MKAVVILINVIVTHCCSKYISSCGLKITNKFIIYITHALRLCYILKLNSSVNCRMACTYVGSKLFTVDTAIDDTLGRVDAYLLWKCKL